MLGFYLLSMYVLRDWIILPRFEALEQKFTQDDILRCQNLFQREAEHASSISQDWAHWDSCYSFVLDGNSEFIEENMDWPSLESGSALNLIYIVNKQGRVVYGSVFCSEFGGFISLDEFPMDDWDLGSYLLKETSPTTGVKGVILSSRGPMIVSSSPILMSDLSGSSVGTLIMGRFIKPLHGIAT